MRFLLAFPALLLFATPAAAQDETPQTSGGGLTVSGEALLLSDYRFRGISRSDEDPALQGTLSVSTPGGLYGGVRGTTLDGVVDLRDVDDVEDFGNVELDVFAGYGARFGLGTTVDVGLMYYYFPGGEGATDYFEPFASVSHTLGPVQATGGVKYAWAQAATGDEDIFYAFGEVEAGIPLTGITLVAQGGRQEAGALGGYWNWSLGGRYQLGPVEAGVRYVDTDLPSLPGQDSGLVLSLGFRF